MDRQSEFQLIERWASAANEIVELKAQLEAANAKSAAIVAQIEACLEDGDYSALKKFL